MVAKTLPIAGLARLTRLPARPIQLAAGLSQVGEFGFVLVSVGVSSGAVSRERFTAVIATVVLTTAGSAILARLASGSRPAGTPETEPEPARAAAPDPT